MNNDLEKLRQLSLHDMPLDSLLLNFEARRLTLVLAQYNERSNGYDELTISFSGIGDLNLSQLTADFHQGNDLEIYSHDLTILPVAHRSKFVLLTGGHSKLAAELSFTFEQVTLG